MGFTSFFSKIGNTIKNAASQGYQSVSNVFSDTKNFIGKQIEYGHSTVTNIINQTGKLANNIVGAGKGIITNAENKFSSIVSTPLMLIGAGIAGLLIFNSKDVSSVANNAINRF